MTQNPSDGPPPQQQTSGNIDSAPLAVPGDKSPYDAGIKDFPPTPAPDSASTGSSQSHSAQNSDDNPSFEMLLQRIKKTESEQGKPVDTTDGNFGKIYAILTNPDMAPQESGKLALDAALQLKSGGAGYDLIWSAFHNDIDALEKNKQYDKAAQLLGSAIDSGHGLSGIREEGAAATAGNLSLLSDSQLARLSSSDRKILEDQLEKASNSLPDGAASDASYLDEQFSRLQRLIGRVSR